MKLFHSLYTIALSTASTTAAFLGSSVVSTTGTSTSTSHAAQRHVVAAIFGRSSSSSSSSSSGSSSLWNQATTTNHLRRNALSQCPSMTQLRMASTTSTSDFIQSQIDSSKVVVFSKSYCPYCRATKSLLEEFKMDAVVTVLELDEMKDGDSIQNELLQMTGQRTVPNTFINGKHIGGNDAIQKLHQDGELVKLLAE